MRTRQWRTTTGIRTRSKAKAKNRIRTKARARSQARNLVRAIRKKVRTRTRTSNGKAPIAQETREGAIPHAPFEMALSSVRT